MLTISHQKIHLEKKLLMDAQEKLKETGKANKGEKKPTPCLFHLLSIRGTFHHLLRVV